MFLGPVLIALLNRNCKMVDEDLSVGGRNHVGLKGQHRSCWKGVWTDAVQGS